MVEPASIILLADAVVAALNAETFTPPFTAERRYVAHFVETELQVLRVVVIPAEREMEVTTRGEDSDLVRVDVGIFKRLTEADPVAESDVLMRLTEDIMDLLRRARLQKFPRAVPVTVGHVPVFDARRWDEERTFAARLTVSYEALR